MKSEVFTTAGFLIGVIAVVVGQAQAAGPGTPFDELTCEAVWTLLSPDGADLSNNGVVPYVVDITMVDTDNNGSVSAAEFKAGCMGAWLKYPEDTAGLGAPSCPAHTCYHGAPYPGCYRC